MTVPAFPLQWPAGWRRIEPGARTRARFAKQVMRTSPYIPPGGGVPARYAARAEVTVADGVARIRAELQRMGVSEYDLVISSNLQLRLDGLPRSGQREPEDPGVAVYWRDSRADGWPQRCMAIDRYDRVADNLAAVAATLEAMRAIERHGGAEILDRAFTGFVALEDQRARWWDVLGVAADARRAEVEAAYRRRRGEAHPDRNGNAVAFDAVQRAYEQARREGGWGRP